MAHRAFTDAYIRNLKVKEAPYKRSEAARRGQGRLTVRVLPTGVKEFFYRYRAGGVDKTVALGKYDPTGKQGKALAAISDKATDLRKLQRDTGDVKEHIRAEDRRKDVAARQGTFRQLLAAYVQSLRDAGKPSAAQAEGIFRRHVLKPFAALANAKANEIESADVQRILARMVTKKITRQVNVARAYLRAAFAYGGKADHDPRTTARDGVLFGLHGRKGTPVDYVPVIREFERVGNRVLTDDELRAFWLALDSLPITQAATLRLNLALASQRPTQLLRAQWGDFDFEQNTLLLRDTKGRGGARDHLLPLTEFALAQLQPLRDLNGTPDKKGKRPPPFSADGKRSMVLETLSVAAREVSHTLQRKHKVPTFQLRDLRRTAETMLQRLGIDREVRAHLLSHGRTTGVQGKHYERYDFLKEKREALERWTEHMQRILDPSRTAQVIPLRRA